MRVTVRYFAMLREQRGCEQETLEIAENTTTGQLYEQLFARVPRVPVAFAVNQAYASPSTHLSEGDEVAFLPPVGGGK